MSEQTKLRVVELNKWFLNHLFWIIPLFFMTMVVGFLQAMFQRDLNDKEILHNTELIQMKIENDTMLIPKINNLKETLKTVK